MNYEVELAPEAQAELHQLSPHTKREVNRVLRRLRNGPDLRVDKRLQDAGGLWSTRAGRGWRVLFYVGPGRQIEVRRIRRRTDAYEGIEHPEHRGIGEAAADYAEVEPAVDVLVSVAAG